MPTEHTTVLLIQFLGLMDCSMCQHIHICSPPLPLFAHRVHQPPSDEGG